MVRIAAILFLLTLLAACRSSDPIPEPPLHYPDSRPYTRWWWFAQPIDRADVRFQLDWLKANGFGGAEIAWVYPPWRYNRSIPKDTTNPKWLSPEWGEAVRFTQSYADSLGLAIDFTFGTAWPAASRSIPDSLGAKVWRQPRFKQRVTFSWEYPQYPLVIDHLDSNAFNAYADPLNRAMQPLLQKGKTALFTDSWEIKLNFTQKPWSRTFGKSFAQQFGYSIEEYMDDLDSHPPQRFDYMTHLHNQVMDGFYKPFVKNARAQGAFSRVQCLASPTNVLSAYGLPDIPESEALLNEPSYSRIPASAAALTGKREVSAEAFTCMYGFPGSYLRDENAADLKLLGDALIAQGVNQIFYHGMPYQAESDSVNFFATTYIGPGSPLSNEIAALNNYFTKVCSLMKQGRVVSDVAMYFPWEDKVMQGALPPEKRRVWVWGEYEMRFLEVPEQLKGYNPLWINGDYLADAVYHDGKLRVGDVRFSILHINVEFMQLEALKEVHRLAKSGLQVVLVREPKQPGVKQDAIFNDLIQELRQMGNVMRKLDFQEFPPLISFPETKMDIPDLPMHWLRETETEYLVFISNPKATNVKYPMVPGESFADSLIEVPIKIQIFGLEISQILNFKPYQSLMLAIDKGGKFREIDIEYCPNDPVLKVKAPQLKYF